METDTISVVGNVAFDFGSILVEKIRSKTGGNFEIAIRNYVWGMDELLLDESGVWRDYAATIRLISGEFNENVLLVMLDTIGDNVRIWMRYNAGPIKEYGFYSIGAAIDEHESLIDAILTNFDSTSYMVADNQTSIIPAMRSNNFKVIEIKGAASKYGMLSNLIMNDASIFTNENKMLVLQSIELLHDAIETVNYDQNRLFNVNRINEYTYEEEIFRNIMSELNGYIDRHSIDAVLTSRPYGVISHRLYMITQGVGIDLCVEFACCKDWNDDGSIDSIIWRLDVA